MGQNPNQEIIEANKFVLAISSPVFETMFFGSMEEDKNTFTTVVDIQPDIFREFVKYLYTDEVEFFDLEFAMSLWYCGNKYMVPNFVKKCSNYLKSVLQANNVGKILEFSQLMNDCPTLTDACLNLIRKNIETVMLSPSWIEINQETLFSVLDLDPLNVTSEVKLFEGLECWMKAKCECLSVNPANLKIKMGDIINKAFSKIRFLLMTPMEFAKGPARSLFMDQTDIFLLLKRISSQDPDDVIPAHFSDICETRTQINFEATPTFEEFFIFEDELKMNSSFIKKSRKGKQFIF